MHQLTMKRKHILSEGFAIFMTDDLQVDLSLTICAVGNHFANELRGCKFDLCSGHSLFLDLVMKIFPLPFSPFRRFKKDICQVLAKEWTLSTG